MGKKNSKVKSNGKVKTNFQTNINDLENAEQRFELYRYMVRKSNTKIDNMTKGKSNDSKEVNYVNSLVDKANAVKSSGKLVDNMGNFIKTLPSGVRKFAQNKKEFMKLNTNQQKALLKGLQELNTRKSYGKNTFTVDGVRAYFSRNESKMRTTIREYMNNLDVVRLAMERAEETGEDINTILQSIENKIVTRIYSEAKNKQNYSSEQITEQISIDVLQLTKKITTQEAEKMSNKSEQEYDELMSIIDENRKERGVPER